MSTLAACIIVGKNESFELSRLLKSIQGSLFDQICVTLTQTDPEVESVAREMATHVSYFEWIYDFSAARNHSFSKAKTTHIMWLDSDDIVTPENYGKLMEYKKKLNSIDVVLMTYNYSHFPDGKVQCTIPRERIVKNDPRLRWQEKIHESINYMVPGLRIDERRDIAIDHYRMKPFNAERNIEIGKKVYESGDYSPRAAYYYAKDMYEQVQYTDPVIKDKNYSVFLPSIEVYEKYIDGPYDYPDNKTLACLNVGDYYSMLGNMEAAVAYWRKAMAFGPAYAEPCYKIGEYYNVTKQYDPAIKYYEMCLTKKMNAGGLSQTADYYLYLPYDRLCQMYYRIGNLEKALQFCDKIISDNYSESSTELFKNNRDIILADINKSKPVDKTLRFAWLVGGTDVTDASYRIRRLNVNDALVSSGIDSKIITLNDPNISNKISDRNVIIFTNYSEYEIMLMQQLKSDGRHVVLDYNEAVHDLDAFRDNVNRVFSISDVVVCCSTKLSEMIMDRVNATRVIFDAVEDRIIAEHDYFNDKKLVAMYMGMGGNSSLVTSHLRDVIESSGYELKVVTEWDNADIKWDIETWPDVLNSADVVLCPQRINVQPGKSNNKVTQAMAYGIPVVASDFPAYKEVIKHGMNGYLCQGKKNWESALLELRDVKKRIQVGMNAAMSVQNYRMDVIANSWLLLGNELVSGTIEKKETPTISNIKSLDTVSVIIPVYKQVEYLKICLDSISLNTTHPYHVIISDAGSDSITWEYLKTLKGYTVLGSPDVRLNFSEACNAGILASSSKYFVLLNSDTVVSKGWLEALVDKMDNTNRLAACGVFSNCDRGWLNGVPGTPTYPMALSNGMELVPAMKLEQITPVIDDLFDFMDKSNKTLKGKYVSQDWVAYYATIFARSAVDEIGLLDTNFKNGCEDLDHAKRLRMAGYEIGQAIDSYVFHFGGITRARYQSEDFSSYGEEDRYNHVMLKKKWDKKHIAIYTGPAWEPWNRNSVDAGMAGSETWAAELGAELSTLGYSVHIFNQCPTDGEIDRSGVQYHSFERFDEWQKYLHIDYVILSRTCEPLKTMRIHSSNIYVMVHDVWLSQDKNYDTVKWAVKKFACLSDWHRDFFTSHHGIENDKIIKTFNGVNSELYTDSKNIIKRNCAVYSSSPDRGLYHLLQMLPKIRAEVPDFELVVTYGMFNWKSAAAQRNNADELAYIKRIEDMLQQPGVVNLGRVNKVELAKLQMDAKVWLYPTTFEETFCITAVENGMAGNAIVTTPYAGLLTTLENTPSYINGPEGTEVRYWANTQEYQDKFIKEAIKMLTDEKYRVECAQRIYDKVKIYTWKNAAKAWLMQFGET